MLATRKFRNVIAGNEDVALVIDDMVSLDPFIARGIRVYGRASGPVERSDHRSGRLPAHRPDEVVELEHGGRARRRHLVRVPSGQPLTSQSNRLRRSSQSGAAGSRRPSRPGDDRPSRGLEERVELRRAVRRHGDSRERDVGLHVDTELTVSGEQRAGHACPTDVDETSSALDLLELDPPSVSGRHDAWRRAVDDDALVTAGSQLERRPLAAVTAEHAVAVSDDGDGAVVADRAELADLDDRRWAPAAERVVKCVLGGDEVAALVGIRDEVDEPTEQRQAGIDDEPDGDEGRPRRR